jgi:hypothetical protein
LSFDHQTKPLLWEGLDRKEEGDCGIVHEYVDWSERVVNFIDESSSVIGHRQIAPEGFGASSARFDHGDRVAQ